MFQFSFLTLELSTALALWVMPEFLSLSFFPSSFFTSHTTECLPRIKLHKSKQISLVTTNCCVKNKLNLRSTELVTIWIHHILHSRNTSWLGLSAQMYSSVLKSITIQQATHIYASSSVQKQMIYKTALKIAYKPKCSADMSGHTVIFGSAAQL